MKEIDIFDVKDYILGHIVSKGENPIVFVLAFFHRKKSAVRCVVRFEKAKLYKKVYHPSYSVKTIDAFFSLSAGAEGEFGRRSMRMIKNLYHPKFLCGGQQHGEIDN